MTRTIKSAISILTCIFLATVAFAQLDTLQRIVPGKKNRPEQIKKPYVILISADGFRWDYAEKYKAQHLLKFAASGVKAQSMIPSFPASTLANHFTLVSGLYPGHSGPPAQRVQQFQHLLSGLFYSFQAEQRQLPALQYAQLNSYAGPYVFDSHKNEYK